MGSAKKLSTVLESVRPTPGSVTSFLAAWRFFTDDPCSMAVISSGSFDKGRCVENLLFLLGSASAIFLLLPQFLRNICRKPDEEAAEATLQAWRVSQSVKPEPKPKARLL